MKSALAWRGPLLKLLLLAMGLLAVGLVPLPRRTVDVRIGSKKFTESVILGEMLALMARASGLEAAHYRELGGTRIVFDSLVAGEIDAYPEYVGTVAKEIFAGQHVADEDALRGLLGQRGIGVSGSLGFDNKYALAMTRKRAAELGVARISDLVRLPELRVAVTHEFLDRADGWRPLAEFYGLPQRDVPGVDHDISFRQLLAGEIDVTDVYTTDAQIRRDDLVVLDDDRAFFPPYDAVWLYRLDLERQNPRLVEAIGKLVGTITEDTMRSLNDEVETRQANESEAAAAFLQNHLALTVAPQESRWTRMIARRVVEHLDLVRRSLIPAIVVGIGLGVYCQRRPRIGRVVLAGVGLLQTIPSLALLVLLLPIVAALGGRSVGEGSITAITALFCYCLLPIVRNTYTGLEGIGRTTVESATVLGLGPTARLTEIELPMALPTILAGVRTAGVQNVGFATLGAIIGAGGLGQTILRGIRLNDTSLILAGALPAALLALLLQLAIDLLEWFWIPRGLKRQAAAGD
jgi:osmoprotectant transport system permease protein